MRCDRNVSNSHRIPHDHEVNNKAAGWSKTASEFWWAMIASAFQLADTRGGHCFKCDEFTAIVLARSCSARTTGASGIERKIIPG